MEENKIEATLYHIGTQIGKISGNVDRLIDNQNDQKNDRILIHSKIVDLNHKMNEHNITMIERLHRLSEDVHAKDKKVSVKLAKWAGFGAGIGAMITLILKFLKGDV